MNAGLEIFGLSVEAGGRALLADVDVAVPRGGVHALIGASGAGKTTLLRAVAGLVPARAGTVAFGGRVFCDPVERVPAEGRRVGFVFQGHGLWPHLDVRGHLAFTLDCMGVRGGDADARIARTIDATGLLGMETRRPDTLSGGERQRLGLARAIVGEPELLLLDEPTASLDPVTAAAIRTCLLDLNREHGTTLLLVTHDQREAFALAGTVSADGRGTNPRERHARRAVAVARRRRRRRVSRKRGSHSGNPRTGRCRRDVPRAHRALRHADRTRPPRRRAAVETCASTPKGAWTSKFGTSPSARAATAPRSARAMEFRFSSISRFRPRTEPRSAFVFRGRAPSS
jgi:ABC-type sugar transport system ATPase subunit